MRFLAEIEDITDTVIEELAWRNISSVELLSIQNLSDLHSLKDRKGLIANACGILGSEESISGTELEEREILLPPLSTGVNKLDRRLHGGFRQGSIIDLVGDHSGLVNYWCYQLATLMSGISKRKILWVSIADCYRELTFKALVKVMSTRFKVDYDDIISMIQIETIGDGTYAPDTDREQLLSMIPPLLEQCTEDYGLVIMNRLDTLFEPKESDKDCQEMDIDEAEYHFEQLASENGRIERQYLELLTKLRRFCKRTDIIILFSKVDRDLRRHTDYGRILTLERNPSRQYFDYWLKCRGINEFSIEMVSIAEAPDFTLDLFMGFGGLYPNKRTMELAQDRLQGE